MDPVKDGVNWYVYCGNNPLAMVDPTGLSGLLSIYSKKGHIGEWGHSWIAFTNDDTGETTTYGTWPTGLFNGKLNENFEKGLVKDKEGISRSTNISDEQEDTLNTLIGEYKDKGDDAWTVFDPCSDFAVDAWNITTEEDLNDRNLLSISDPDTLYDSIENANEKDSDYTDYSYWYNMSDEEAQNIW